MKLLLVTLIVCFCAAQVLGKFDLGSLFSFIKLPKSPSKVSQQNTNRHRGREQSSSEEEDNFEDSESDELEDFVKTRSNYVERERQKRLNKCCKKRIGEPEKGKLAKTCQHMCEFKNMNVKMFTDAYSRNKCPKRSPRIVLNCASGFKDHTRCCREKKVKKVGFVDCLRFCRPTKVGHIDMSIWAYPCLSMLDKITACFKR